MSDEEAEEDEVGGKTVLLDPLAAAVLVEGVENQGFVMVGLAVK